MMTLEAFDAAKQSACPIQVAGASPPRGDKTAEFVDGTHFLSSSSMGNARYDVDEAHLQTLGRQASLKDYQYEGVRFLVSRQSALLADDMGLGKSRQATVAAHMMAGAQRVLVVCPASLRLNWQREIKAVLPDAAVGIVGVDRIEMLHRCEWVVANYERLGTLVKEDDLTFAVMLVDEAHNLKEHQAGRTRNTFLMRSRIERCILLTGTPLMNREVELHTLLRLTGHALGALPLKTFRKQYTGSLAKQQTLATELRGWKMRRKKNVLKDLGTKTRQVRHIQVAEGLGAYQAVLKDMSLQVMPKIGRLRQTLETLKIGFATEMIEGLGEGQKMIVFCQYIPTVDVLRDLARAMGVGAVSLVGSDSLAKRQKAVDAFQTNPDIRLFVTTFAAGGVGITLTAATVVLAMSGPWTPALMTQAEDRAYRLGQTKDVLVVVPLILGTIDEQVWKLLGLKAEIADVVIDEKEVNEKDIEQAAIRALRALEVSAR
jgi:SNF2 family DNA or RNA helicase